MLRLVNRMLGLVLIGYPLLVYLGLHVLVPWQLSTALMLVLVLRFLLYPRHQKTGSVLLGAGVLYCLFAIWHNTELSLRFYPVWINLCLFGLFFISLLYPPSFVERLARLQDPNLSQHAIQYTQKVTVVWCIFFIVNGGIATATALWSDFFWWSLYNGLIAYVLIGLLMGIEYGIRIRMQRHDH